MTKKLSTDALLVTAASLDEDTADGKEDEGRKRLRELTFRLVEEEIARRDNEVTAEKKMHLQRIKTAEDHDLMIDNEKAQCSHRKPDGRPRTGAQVLSDGRLYVLCLGCPQEWFYPPNKERGELSPPQDLLPSGNDVGSANPNAFGSLGT